MAQPVDPFPNFINNVDIADGDKVDARFVALYTALRPSDGGGVDDSMVATAGLSEVSLTTLLQQRLGLNDGAQIGRGKSIIAGTHSRTNVAFGKLGATPGVDADQVTGVVLPADSFMVIMFQALWQCSVSGAGRAAVFLGGTQTNFASNDGTTHSSEATHVGAANTDTQLTTTAGGLATVSSASTMSYAAVGNIIGSEGGQAIGGPMYVEATPGTYDVSVQFKSSSGSVSVKNRKLWVWTFTP